LRRFIILLHRYLGIPMSVVFVVWIVSADGAGVGGFPGEVTLQSALGRPAYKFAPFPGATLTVFADTGEVLDWVTADQARTVAAAFVGVPEQSVSFVQTLTEPDQWTLLRQRNLPMHEFSVDDGLGTTVYVGEESGEVALVTDRRARVLAWLGTIPHWFYFSPLRHNQPLWYWTVVWAAAVGCLLTSLGLILGVTQFRRSKPFRLSESIRYRGWMRWHYLTGAIFGVFALTWAFSGMLSMEPFAWTRVAGLQLPSDVLSGGPIELRDYPRLDEDRWQAMLGQRTLKEIDYLRVDDAPFLLVRYTDQATADAAPHERLHQPYAVALGSGDNELLVDARTLRVRDELFQTETLVARLRKGTDVPIESYELLSDYDAYYYSQTGQASLPVLRVKFDDPERTWYYVDPKTGAMLAAVHRFSRLERWLFNGLHSLDFGFWHDKRPLWDIGMILLSLGALATSLIGMFVGFKRLRVSPRPAARNRNA